VILRLLAGAALAVALVTPAAAQHPAGHPPQPEAGKAVSLQGPQEQNAWAASPHMRRFYDATKAAFANGPDKVDVPAFEETSRKIFDEFARSMGSDPAAMQDHLKLIPRQMVQIAREDPATLKSYDAFIEALMGPK
jgi:hypothetical protein